MKCERTPLKRDDHIDDISALQQALVDKLKGAGCITSAQVEAAFSEVTAGHHRADARHLYEELGYDGTVAAYLRKRL